MSLYEIRHDIENKRKGNKHFYQEMANEFEIKLHDLLTRNMSTLGIDMATIFDMDTAEYQFVKDCIKLGIEWCVWFEAMSKDYDRVLSDLELIKGEMTAQKKQNEYLIELLKEIKEQTKNETETAITVK